MRQGEVAKSYFSSPRTADLRISTLISCSSARMVSSSAMGAPYKSRRPADVAEGSAAPGDVFPDRLRVG